MDRWIDIFSIYLPDRKNTNLDKRMIPLHQLKNDYDLPHPTSLSPFLPSPSLFLSLSASFFPFFLSLQSNTYTFSLPSLPPYVLPLLFFLSICSCRLHYFYFFTLSLQLQVQLTAWTKMKKMSVYNWPIVIIDNIVPLHSRHGTPTEDNSVDLPSTQIS